MSAARDYSVLIGVGVLALVTVYVIGRKTVKDAAELVGGVVSGNNALTKDTPYEGWGVFGTAGAVVNDALGGMPQTFGEWLGGKTYDLTH